MTYQEKKHELKSMKVYWGPGRQRISWLIEELEKAWAALEAANEKIASCNCNSSKEGNSNMQGLCG